MIAGFYIKDLTVLRYFIPLIKVMKRELKENLEVKLFLDFHLSHKYNTLNNNANVKILQDVIANHVKKTMELTSGGENLTLYLSSDFKKNDNPKIYVDALFVGSTLKSSEIFDLKNNTFFSYRKKIVIQHGFDYIGPAGGCRAACKDTIFIVNDELYSRDITERIGTKASCIVTEHPVPYWTAKEQIDFLKSSFNLPNNKKVFVMYPESGYHNIVQDHVNFLIDSGYFVIIKQRRKNQNINSKILGLPKNKVLCVYDDIWYPSESIFFPMICDFVVGYGTSSYVDFVKFNIPYIDFALPEYSKIKINYDKLGSSHLNNGLPYVKPIKNSNFYYSEEASDFKSIVNEIVKTDSPTLRAKREMQINKVCNSSKNTLISLMNELEIV